MSALSFLMKGKKNVKLAYFNHNTDHSHKAERFVRRIARSLDLKISVGCYEHQKPGKKPSEADWRIQRYKFFQSLNTRIITAHHLDDSAEWWLFTSLRGSPKVIPIARDNPDIIRPFVLTSKAEFHKVSAPSEWIEDPSNSDKSFSRNRIRHSIMPEALRVNPGFLKNVRKAYR